jgi:hypothetical protein
MESMQHTVECPVARRFWDLVFKFAKDVMGFPLTSHRRALTRLIVYNEKDGALAPPEVRAIIRHAYGAFYRTFTLVSTADTAFDTEATFERTLHTFHEAVLRHGVSIRRFHVSRRNSSLNMHLSEESRKQFGSLIDIQFPNYNFSITKPFTDAVIKAERDTVEARKRRSGQVIRPPPPHLRPPPRGGTGP